MSDVEALAWNDGRLAAAESAVCVCRHATLDHAWHGCENCACTRSAVHALLTSDWLAAYVAAERDRAVREASDYDFGACVCGRAIVKHKSREGYWHVNGSLRFDHDTALRAALRDDREGEDEGVTRVPFVPIEDDDEVEW